VTPARDALRLAAALGLACGVGAGAVSSSASDPPRGHLVAIGGGPRPASIMRLVACLAGGPDGKVLVFPQASERPETGPELEAELTALGIGQVLVIAADRARAEADETLRLTEGATGVYFSGGDQNRLTAVLGGTRLAERLRQLHRDGAVIAGTSAGAAVLGRVMITGDERRPFSKDEAWQTIEADNVVTGDGLGFIEDAIVDQHFVRRRRHNRLLSLVLERPALVGLAVDEATAAWVKPDRSVEVVGDGPVLVVDGRFAEVARDGEGHGLRGRDLRVHVLRSGARYDLDRRTVLRLARPEGEPDGAAACAGNAR
jgi:cyanophycinase